jgi:hypothetical protein
MLLFLFIEDSAVTEIHARTAGNGGATFPRTKMGGRRCAMLCIQKGDNEKWVNLETEATFPFVDLFPSGDIIVCGSRCRRLHDGKGELNATVYSDEGSVISRHSFGDGIEDLAVDELGRIWVSYFDEGVYGNFGWGNDEESRPNGSSGLVCFGSDGRKLWEFEAYDGSDNRVYIDDAYALNVHRARAKVFFYSDFAITDIDPSFNTTTYGTDLRGCHAFASSGQRFLFSGGYGENANKGHLCQIASDGRFKSLLVEFAKEDGSKFKEGHFRGRGPALYYFEKNGVWAADVSDR